MLQSKPTKSADLSAIRKGKGIRRSLTPGRAALFRMIAFDFSAPELSSRL
jgi:hypothetical protein